MAIEEYFGEWYKVLPKDELFKTINQINKLYSTKKCTPEYQDIFNVFTMTPYRDLKVIMLFQDPYPQQGVATGVALANKKDVKELSPSLEVVKESVIDFEIPHFCCTFDPTLEEWSKQGILLLNTALTVEVGKPSSHSYIWRPFIKKLLYNIGMYNPGLIYMLWGTSAKTFESSLISPAKVVKLQHPAFFARTSTKIPCSVFKDLIRDVKYYFDETIELYQELKTKSDEEICKFAD